MFMELIQSFALMLSARWPILGTTIEGRYCTAQGTCLRVFVFFGQFAICLLPTRSIPPYTLFQLDVR
ncbi:hypothetical protein DL93DRAFT_2089272 [Clavulina sp. PMI_390]|nr:hypothetical protein DL93DRAFT_2089272 [Clavulina sp. PMI_390]